MRDLAFGERTFVMGIINVTPDSFSGDGLAPAGRTEQDIVAAALAQARGFVDAGAIILDVGAESSRPAAVYGEHPPVDAATEAGLAVPVVAALASELGERAMVSIDTTKGSVARAALAAGATMVNDVWAGSRDADTARAAAETGAYYVAMHNKEVAEYAGDVVAEVIGWLGERAEAAAALGVGADRIIVDPGIGFGKTPAHSLEVLHRLAEVRAACGLPMLVGTSRKRFIGEVLDDAPPEDRLEGTLASVVAAIGSGADIVRVHDVAPVARAVRVADAILRRSGSAPQAAAAVPGRVTVTGILAQGRHGVTDEERSRAQPFEVDLAVELDVAAAAKGDRLEDAVDYTGLQRVALTTVASTSFHLVETLATTIGRAVLETWPAVRAVEVALRKPEAAMPGPVAGVEVRIRLTRTA
jgi:dihydropteroate synthase